MKGGKQAGRQAGRKEGITIHEIRLCMIYIIKCNEFIFNRL